jgi:hypothetical protein
MRKNYQRIPQPTPQDLTDSCLNFLRTKFYRDDAVSFAKDRSRLLEWVVLWPASWLNDRGVTIHGDAYREIFIKTFLEADMHRATKITYLPAWLRYVIQSHFKIHGEDYYQAAKNVRTLAEHALIVAGQHRQPTPDPVREMANAHQILASQKRRLTPSKRPVKQQLNLL